MAGYILDDVEKLLAEARRVAQRYLEIVPEPVKQQHWILAKHEPDPWGTLCMEHPAAPGLDGISTLARVIAFLDGLILREKAQGREPNLRLVKVRRHGV